MKLLLEYDYGVVKTWRLQYHRGALAGRCWTSLHASNGQHSTGWPGNCSFDQHIDSKSFIDLTMSKLSFSLSVLKIRSEYFWLFNYA